MKKKTKPVTNTSGIVFSTDPSFSFGNGQPSIETLPETKQVLKIKLDTKQRAGKAVTLIQGFIGKEDDLEQLGKKLKNFCGTGGSVKDAEIIIQGDHRDKVLQWLVKNGYVKTRKL
ncbi:MAG: translation initiation factor [Chitinophagaceae bacterium]|nr:translation initiation factor [Chitinophagaceae bacterium]